MDQLKIILGHMRKHHFWILCVVVVLLGLFGWYRGTSTLASVYVTQVGAIKGKFQSVQGVASNAKPPNDRWKVGVDQVAQKQRQEVKATWDALYAEQTDKVLKWPTDLGPEFLKFVRDHNPSEEIPRRLRESYQYYIREEFPHLLEIVKAPNTKASSEPSGRGNQRPIRPGNAKRRQPTGPMQPDAVIIESEDDYLVEWVNQGDVAAALDLQETPSSQQLRNLQEDLWVYRTLLNIVATVNERATGRYNTKIKVIKRIDIGPQAAQDLSRGASTGKIFVPTGGSGPTAGTGPNAGGFPTPGQAPPTAMNPSPGATPSAEGSDDGRYVDEQGKPMSSSAAQQGEFKRMPVYLELVMDQREIHALLAACANSPLPVEVRQLRVNSLAEAAAGRAGGSSAGFGGPGPSGRAGTDQDQNANDVSVELHGIIYIFNAPDMAKLGATGEATPAAATGAEATSGAQPGVAPATGAETPAAVPPESGPAPGQPAAGTAEPQGAPAATSPAQPGPR